MSSQAFNISLPKELIKQIDAQAKRDYSTRSDYIRRAVVNQLQKEQALDAFFNRTNKIGKEMGITSEQQVYDIIGKE